MAELPSYDAQAIELRHQARWKAEERFRARDDVPRERCYYVLEMFPYPSGKLHMGHVRNYSIGDAVARYQRMRGFHVLHPIGFDAFGLPAEQAAIERQQHPGKWTWDNVAYMRDQLARMGFSYDWRRELVTCDQTYAAREQKLFLDLNERGLVFRKSSIVNWSTGLNTVLANEQVVDGKCWRTGAPVIQKELPQWFLRITDYAQELVDDLDTLTGWPEAVKTMQRNWIGRSEGAEIDFAVQGRPGTIITIYTTRPDTVFGVTFMSLAPEHPLVDQIVTADQRAAVAALRDSLRGQSAEERTGENAPKRGCFTGAYAINPVNGEAVPVWIANFVLGDYGTGAVMAVPAHDTRDFAFAQAHHIPIRRVIAEDGVDSALPMEAAFTGVGSMIHSSHFDGQRSDEAKRAITAWLASTGKGRAVVSWRLRDWGLSRQRYWGNPIPFLHSEQQGITPVPEQELPVWLPQDVTFDGIGNPLEKHKTWATTGANGKPLTVKTASGREVARRETDTMDTFMESSWYFARYCCHDRFADDQGCAAPLDKTRVDHWLPVDLYIGGIEHACMHLLYARFFQKALCDAGYSSVREPFKRLLCQGMVCMETYSRAIAGATTRQWFYPDEVEVVRDDKGRVTSATAKADGQPVEVGRVEKMSKSKRNTVDPQQIINRFGADTARLFILFAAPPEKDLIWDDAAVAGANRFLKRVWNFVHEHNGLLCAQAAYAGKVAELADSDDQALLRKVHATVARATQAMERDFSFNTAIAGCMELLGVCEARRNPAVLRRAIETLLCILAPMAPHIACELWNSLGHSGDIEEAGWPSFDPAEMVEAEVEYPVQVNGKVRRRIRLPQGLSQAELEPLVREHSEFTAALDGKTLKKLIIIPGKIITAVV